MARRSGDRQGLVPGAHRPGPARRGRRPVPRRRPGRRGRRGRGRRARPSAPRSWPGPGSPTPPVTSPRPPRLADRVAADRPRPARPAGAGRGSPSCGRALAGGDPGRRPGCCSARPSPLWEELDHPLGQGRDAPRPRPAGRRRQHRAGPAGRAHPRARSGARRLADGGRRPGGRPRRRRPTWRSSAWAGSRCCGTACPSPLGEWKSRKARDLVKIAVARGGRPVHREALRELLWPADDPGQTASRLSVALSTARAVLDPAKEHPPGWFLGADNDTVWIDTDHVDVDIDRFHELATQAGTERKAGPSPAATRALAAAEAAYVGDAFPEDPYEDWSVSLRERTRASYIWVARTLADDSARRRRPRHRRALLPAGPRARPLRRARPTWASCRRTARPGSRARPAAPTRLRVPHGRDRGRGRSVPGGRGPDPHGTPAARDDRSKLIRRPLETPPAHCGCGDVRGAGLAGRSRRRRDPRRQPAGCGGARRHRGHDAVPDADELLTFLRARPAPGGDPAT